MVLTVRPPPLWLSSPMTDAGIAMRRAIMRPKNANARETRMWLLPCKRPEVALLEILSADRVHAPPTERGGLPSHLCPLRNATLRVPLGFSLSGRATAAPQNVLPVPRGNAREDHLSLLEIAQEKYGKLRRTASTTKSCRLKFTGASSKCFQARHSRSTSTTATQFWRTSPDVYDGTALRFFQVIALT